MLIRPGEILLSRMSRPRDSQTSRLVGFAGQVKGCRREERVLVSVLSRRNLWPSWLVSIRLSSQDEDELGWDLVAVVESKEYTTFQREIGIQVKSSRKSAQRFRQNHPCVPVIVIRDNDRSSQIFLRVIDVLKQEIERLSL